MSEYTYEQAVEAGRKAMAAGDYQAADDIADYIDLNGLAPADTPVANKLTEALEQRYATASSEPVDGGLHNPVRKVGRLGGAGAGLIADTMGIALEPLVPEELEEAIQSGMEYLYQSKAGQLWQEFDEKHPELAQDVRDVGNMATFMVPRFGPKITGRGKAMKARGLEAKHQHDRELIQDMVLGDQRAGQGNTMSSAELLEAAEKGQPLPGTVDEVGAARTRKYNPTPDEVETIEYLHTLPEIKPARSRTYNLGVVQRKLVEAERDLNNQLVRYSKRTWDVDTLEESIREAVNVSRRAEGSRTLGVENSKLIDSMYEDLRDILRDVPDTPQGLVEARRRFDAIVNAGGDVLGDPKVSVKQRFGRVMRGELNDKLDFLAPDAYDARFSQSKLYDAWERMEPMVRTEGTNMWRRLMASQLIPHTALSIVGSGAIVAGLATEAVSTPAVVAAGLGAAGAYGIYRGLSKRNRVRVSGAILKEIDKAMKTATGETLSQLKLDRAAIVDQMKLDEEPREQ